MSGPFRWHGRDLYRENRVLYYAMQVLLWVYVLGYVASLVLLLNVYVRHTYTAIPGMPGTLFTERFITMRWAALMLGAARMFIPIAVLALVLFRNTRGCNTLWLVVLVLLLFAEVFIVGVLAAEWAGCNEPGNPYNLCNSPVYCCVPDVNNDPTSLCPNPPGSICPATASLPNPPATTDDLLANTDFIWLMVVSLAFLAFDIVLVSIPLCIWRLGSMPSARHIRTVVRPQAKTAAEQMELGANANTANRRPHRLKSDNGDTTTVKRK